MVGVTQIQREGAVKVKDLFVILRLEGLEGRIRVSEEDMILVILF